MSSTDETMDTWSPTAVVGLSLVLLVVVLAVVRLYRETCRGFELQAVVRAEKDTLFHFLSDPHNLKIIHPYTTEIWVEEEERGEGGTRRTRFRWVEKVPCTVESSAILTCRPDTRSVQLDITPAGAMFTVQLKWRCSDIVDDPNDVIKESASQHHGRESVTDADAAAAVAASVPPATDGCGPVRSRPAGVKTEEREMTEKRLGGGGDGGGGGRGGGEGGGRGGGGGGVGRRGERAEAERGSMRSEAGDDISDRRGPGGLGAEKVSGATTLFENSVSLRGPLGVVFLVELLVLRPVQKKLTKSLQRHFQQPLKTE